MVTNNEILASLDSVAPFNLAMDWDNVGLLLDMNGPSQRILFALDLTPEVVMEARAKGCGAMLAVQCGIRVFCAACQSIS